MARHERVSNAPIQPAGGDRTKRRRLAREVLIATESTLRESVDGMTQAVSELERLGQLASSLAHETAADAAAPLSSRH